MVYPELDFVIALLAVYYTPLLIFTMSVSEIILHKMLHLIYFYCGLWTIIIILIHSSVSVGLQVKTHLSQGQVELKLEMTSFNNAIQCIRCGAVLRDFGLLGL